MVNSYVSDWHDMPRWGSTSNISLITSSIGSWGGDSYANGVGTNALIVLGVGVIATVILLFLYFAACCCRCCRCCKYINDASGTLTLLVLRVSGCLGCIQRFRVFSLPVLRSRVLL
jgi:hypothetical protein